MFRVDVHFSSWCIDDRFPFGWIRNWICFNLICALWTLGSLWEALGPFRRFFGSLWGDLGCLGAFSELYWKLDIKYNHMCTIHYKYKLKLVSWNSHPDPAGPAEVVSWRIVKNDKIRKIHTPTIQGSVFCLREPKRHRQLRHSRKGLGALKW